MQSRRLSLIEALTGTAIGFAASVLLGLFIYPKYGFQPTLGDNVELTLAFTVLSVVRGYLVRRAFNYAHLYAQKRGKHHAA